MIKGSIPNSCRQYCIFLRNKCGIAATGKVQYAVRLQQLNEEIQLSFRHVLHPSSHTHGSEAWVHHSVYIYIQSIYI